LQKTTNMPDCQYRRLAALQSQKGRISKKI